MSYWIGLVEPDRKHREIDSNRNLGTVINCYDILTRCYIGFIKYPDGIIAID